MLRWMHTFLALAFACKSGGIKDFLDLMKVSLAQIRASRPLSCAWERMAEMCLITLSSGQ